MPKIKRNVKLLYLGVFNNKTWIPIAYSEINRGKAIFHNLESGIVYQALIYQNEQLIPFFVPFIALDNGQPYFLLPNKEKLQTMRIDRKYPQPDWIDKFQHRSRGGLFQAANRNNFSDVVTLFTTSNEFDMKYHRIEINNRKKFKYLRYFSAFNSRNNMAEIQFFGDDGNELTGDVIGTDGSNYHTLERSKYAVFDKDPVTFFDAIPLDTAWVGLELGIPSTVTEIEFLYRNDDNGIREGDIYELFYFSDTGLISLGKRTGIKNGVLIYENVPSNSLYLLHNETRGREERIFTYENGKQVWW